LYKNDDIIAELEKRIAGLDIEDSKDSSTLKDLVAKKTGLEERKFTKVVR